MNVYIFHGANDVFVCAVKCECVLKIQSNSLNSSLSYPGSIILIRVSTDKRSQGMHTSIISNRAPVFRDGDAR